MLKDLLETIRRETQPIAGHTDPRAIEDCWRMVFEELEAAQQSVQRTAGGLCVLCNHEHDPAMHCPEYH